MCMSNDSFNGNKVQVCTVRDLKPGQQFRDPHGNTFMAVTSDPNDDYGLVVSLSTGYLFDNMGGVKLGRDRCGRLYASRSLNNPQPQPDAVVNAENENLLP